VPNSDDTLPASGPALERAFASLVNVLNQRGIQYAIVGGLATIQHTRVRTTDDIDALLSVTQLALPGLFEALQARGFSVDVTRNVRELRDDGLTTIRFADVVVDLLRPIVPAYAHVLERAITTEIRGQSVRISSAEGLIVMKLMAMRPQDQADIAELLTSYAGRLDLDFVRSELDTFTDASDPRRATFEEWVRRSLPAARPEQDAPG
jgi:predicted nucleotidyltransferase